jgi:hypothetical protein
MQAEVEDDDDEEVEEHKPPDQVEDQQEQAKRPRPPQKQGMQQEEDSAQPLSAVQHIQRNMKILQAQQVTIDAALEEMRAMAESLADKTYFSSSFAERRTRTVVTGTRPQTGDDTVR